MTAEVVADLDPIEVAIEPLDRSHVRGAFSCGRPKIDNFFRQNARAQHEAYRVRVFVAVEPGSKRAVGFHSLVLAALIPSEVSKEADELFSRHNAVPVVYLSMIGVHHELQGRSIGTRLMRDAFERALTISENAGAYALTLDAATDQLVETYRGLGFDLFQEGERRMFITLAEIRKTLAA